MKGTLQPDHVPDNSYVLMILGMPPLTLTSLGSLEDELNTTKLPDRTVASGGNREATELDIDMPMHHKVEQTAMEFWYRLCQDPVSPGYKKPGLIVYKTNSGGVGKAVNVLGVFIKKRVIPESKMDGEGEMKVVTWTFSIDDVQPII